MTSSRPRIAINGFGRIGRALARALFERGLHQQFELVAINELAALDVIAYLTRHDSTHGLFPVKVAVDGKYLVLGDVRVRVLNQADAAQLPWDELAIDCVLECSGQTKTRADAELHLRAGAKRVLISNPADKTVDATVVCGVNDDALSAEMQIVSAASCTTNAVVPVIAALDSAFGVERGMLTTIHSAMNDQPLLDGYHSDDLRKTRAALQSVIPVATQLARGIERILPTMAGRFEAHALRVPTQNVSAMDMTLWLTHAATVEQVNAALAAESDNIPEILGFSSEPLASCDFNHDPRSGVVDAGQTLASGQMVKVLVWFDNEWAYANRMLDITARWLQ